jgi:predicted PurR-regulated permease PerM
MMKMKLKWSDVFKGAAGIFLLYLAIHYWPAVAALGKNLVSASLPLIIGCVVAYLVNILMAAYERMYCPGNNSAILSKCRRPVCMLLAFVTLIAIVALVFGLILPQLGECVGIILEAFPGFMNKVIDLAEELQLFAPEVLQSLESIDWKSQVGKLVGIVTSGIGSVVDVVVNAVSSVFSWVVTALLALIFSIYLLAEKEKLAAQIRRILNRYVSRRFVTRFYYFVEILDDCFHRYIVGQCTEAVILGFLCAIGMRLLQLPYALMVGALVAFTALIPVAGTYIGAGVGAFMILTVDPMKAVIFLVFLVVLQQLEGNLIYPRVVGSSMGLPGIWVLAAVTVGGGLAGIAGMLLGVPLAAVAYRIIRDDVKKQELREYPEETEKNDPAS